MNFSLSYRTVAQDPAVRYTAEIGRHLNVNQSDLSGLCPALVRTHSGYMSCSQPELIVVAELNYRGDPRDHTA